MSRYVVFREYGRLANTRQIIDPDSVGMPYGRQGARWAILSGAAVKMRRTAYDPVAACAQVTESSSYPGVAKWTGYFLHARATGTDALAVMASRDGRAWPAAVS